ncbi:MAG TPA: ribosome maturation factor RimP [Bacillales bacterium]|nr:ribosome maturation factor RimP [Bacillales bacterium]
MAERVTETAERLVVPILEAMQLELVDVEFVKEGKHWYLRIYIDSDEGVGLDECSAVSEQLSERLDEQEIIDQAYFLEVSSPGAERPLKKDNDFRGAVGKHVRITTYAPIDGAKAFEGKLTDFDGNRLQLAVQDKTIEKQVEIPIDKVASARLAVVFH